MKFGLKSLMPRTLLARSLLILILPLVLLQVISAFVFYEGHWDQISKYLARGLAGDIGAIVELARGAETPEARQKVFSLAQRRMNMPTTFHEGAILGNDGVIVQGSIPDSFFLSALDERVGLPYRILAPDDTKSLTVEVQLGNGVIAMSALRKRLFSSTTYVFVLWMVGSSLLLFGVAMVFLRNQVRPIRKLAAAANAFGKRQSVAKFKPEGAREVRQAAAAFLVMRDRIERQIDQRTSMLAGVSHDLRTPLTRMKLQLSMMGTDEDIQDLQTDIQEMEHMLDGYLAFARGEGGEQSSAVDMSALVESIVTALKRKNVPVHYHCEGQISLLARPRALKRCITNLAENAAKFGDHVAIRVGHRDQYVDITIDDDGPGIPEQARNDVFKPFFRLDASRNSKTGGVGLGLSIVRDIVRSHGGDITLSESPQGGLRARVQLPL